MRLVTRSLVAATLVGVTFVLGGGSSPRQTVRAQQVKDTARVLVVDSNASFAAGNEYLGGWGYAPAHVMVQQGEPIEFDNPAGNFFPHTVVSISWSGTAQDRSLASGQQFNSSPTREQYITPGGSWVLDTSTLDAGQYVYYCSIHPWMVGTFTVAPTP